MHIRPPHVAGSFYDANADTLAAYVRQSLQDAQKNSTSIPQEVTMALLPHAGHFYCGHIIAQALTRIRLQKRLIILCPNHTGQGAPLAVWYPQQHTPSQSAQQDSSQKQQGQQDTLEQGQAKQGVKPNIDTSPEYAAWQTPLGNVPLDVELAEKIIQYDIWGNTLQKPSHAPSFSPDTTAHAREHSIEVLLPFLQEWAPQCRIVPIAVRSHDFSLLQRAGLALGELLKQEDDVSIIVSSDMHHFSDHATTLELDNKALEALLAFDPLRLAQVVQEHQISMCGVCPAILAMYACKVLDACVCTQLNHTTSYEKGGDASRVVGYASLIVQKRTC